MHAGTIQPRVDIVAVTTVTDIVFDLLPSAGSCQGPTNTFEARLETMWSPFERLQEVQLAVMQRLHSPTHTRFGDTGDWRSYHAPRIRA